MSRALATTDVYFAIADPTRRRILDLLSPGELPVLALARQFDVTVSAISQHMRVLREVGLVSVQHRGRERFYRLEAAPLRDVSAWLGKYEPFWQTKMDALGEYLEEES